MNVLFYVAVAFIQVRLARAVFSSWRPKSTDSYESSSSVLTQCLALFIFQYTAAKVYSVFLYPRFFSPLRSIPGPKDNHFLFGQTFNLLNAETPVSLPVEWMKKEQQHKGQGSPPFIRYLGFANSESLIPNSIAAYRELSQTKCYSLSKPDWFVRSVSQMNGEGVFLLEGAEHRSQRRLLNGPFSRRSISRLHPVFKDKANDICTRLGDVIDGHHNNNNGVFECEHILSKATIEVMSTAVLGIDYEKARPPSSSSSFDDGNKPHNYYNKHQWTFLSAFETFFNPGGFAQLLMFANGYVPIRWLPLETNREASSAAAWVHDVLGAMVEGKYREIRQAMAGGHHVPGALGRDLLTFIVEEDLLDGKATGIAGSQFVGHLIQTLGGGYDTTAIMLSWTCYVLAKDHEIQKALRYEILQTPEDISVTELEKLPYLDNFVKEVLRVYPPAPSIPRKTDVDLVVEGVFIPAGTLIDMRPSVMLENPAIWGDDAHLVDPSRWDRLTEEQSSPFAYNVFSNGPRICVGRQFALCLLKTVIVELVRNFRFVRVVKEYEKHKPGFMFKPLGLEVQIERV